MKLFATMLLSIVLTMSLVFGQTNSKAEQEIIQIRQEMGQANDRADVKAMDKIMADDYVWIAISGETGGKKDTLAGLHTEKPKGVTIAMTDSEMKYRIYGDTGIVTGVRAISFTMDGKTQKSIGRFTEVWLKRKGHWQIVSLQGTPMK